MAVHLSSRIRKAIEQRDSAGLCLLCENKPLRRGLCSCCYGRYRAALSEQPKKERPALEAKLIEAGKLLENRQGHRRDVVNVFRQFAQA